MHLAHLFEQTVIAPELELSFQFIAVPASSCPIADQLRPDRLIRALHLTSVCQIEPEELAPFLSFLLAEQDPDRLLCSWNARPDMRKHDPPRDGTLAAFAEDLVNRVSLPIGNHAGRHGVTLATLVHQMAADDDPYLGMVINDLMPLLLVIVPEGIVIGGVGGNALPAELAATRGQLLSMVTGADNESRRARLGIPFPVA